MFLLIRSFSAAIAKRNYKKAITWLDKIKIAHSFENLDDLQAQLLAIKGQKGEAIKLSKSSYVYLLLGMDKEALIELKKETERNPYLKLINNPIYKPLRTKPEFKELVLERKKVYDERLVKYASDLP